MEIENFKVNRTTIAIYNTMLRLLSQRGFNEITVNDICQDAMVSRSTFYAHFKDKYHLILFFLEQERNQLGIVRGENIKENLYTMLRHFQAEEKVYQHLLLSQTNAELNNMITSHIQATVAYTLKKVIPEPEKLQVQTVLFSTGLAGSILWWIKENFPIEAEVFVEYLYEPLQRIVEQAE